MSDNWIVSILESALTDWNGKLSEIWTLLTQTPQSFKGGDIWTAVSGIHTAMVGVGYGLLVLFFAMGIFQSAASFRDFQRPEFALRHFIRFILAKVAVGSCMEIMTAIFSVCGGIVATVMSGMGGSVSTAATLPSEIVTAIEGLGLLESIPLWLVSLLGSLFITVMSFILLLTVYGRFFRLYMFTALAPLPLASFAGEGTAASGKAFLKSYIGVCMEGAVIVLACLIYSAFLSSSSPAVDSSLPAVTMAWQYIGQLIFNMLILTGLVKGADRIVKEMLGL
ncbi:hypothetical protein AALA80_01790 [Oscillospiraceae bacterium 50-60]|uniref:hypothetical protein n=3 Tax=uncultured Oscillibacter sp. TaxID=876091 RepID=UPI0025DD474D|nr:hypothetical protein [uncultured Oscillibacter sp.]